MRLFDCHTHLDEYTNDEVTQILERAENSGVAGAIIAGTTLKSSVRCVDLAQNDHRLFAGVGMHPMDLTGSLDSSTREALLELAKNPRVITISEVGLDSIDRAPSQDIQEDVFRTHIQIARQMKLPIIYHARMAYPRILDVLEEEHASDVGGAAHYFQGDINTARRCIELGFYISLARPLLRIPELQEVVQIIPMENIVLETDAYPQPFKKRRESWTEPRHVMEVALSVANLKRINIDEVIEQAGHNLIRMLGNRGNQVKAILDVPFE